MGWDLRTTSVVVVGAGFSAAVTNGRMPLMNTFFDELDQSEFPSLYDYACRVSCNPREANLERILLALGQMRSSPPVALKGWVAKWGFDPDKIERELSLYTLARFRSALCEEVEDDNWAAALFADCGPATTVISMNYDNIAESILSNRDGMTHCGRVVTCPHCKMRMLLEQSCSCGGRFDEISERDWKGTILKPHGSIAWRRCLNSECCSYQCLVADEYCRPFEPCGCDVCGIDCGTAMVMPSMSKDLSKTPEIGIMWHAALEALTDAESVLLFGFSLPESDELLGQMIRASALDGGKLRRVASIDLAPNTVLQRFANLIPELPFERWPFEVERGKRPAWLKDLASSVVSS